MLLKDDVGGSRVKSRARSHVKSRVRSRVILYNHKSCNHDVIIFFFFGVNSDERIIVKSYLQLGKKSPNPTGKKGGKPVLL